MAICMRMRWDGVTPDLYDEVRKVVDWEGNPAAGGLLHVPWFVGDQLNVTDVWESAEAFNNFVETRLMPGVAQVGISGQPAVEIQPIYNWQYEASPTTGAVVEEDELPLAGYQALEATVGWREHPPTGGILHIARVDGDTVRTVSVWEAAADHDNFESDRLAPAAAAMGFPAVEDHRADFHTIHTVFHPAGGPTRS